MKKLFLLLVVLLFNATLFAKESNERDENHYYLVQTNSMTVKTVTKEYLFNGTKIVLSAGLDTKGEISELTISKSIGMEAFLKLKAKVQNGETCVTRCSRANGCSNKEGWGAAICAGECIIDCAAKLIKELQEESANPSTQN